MEDSPIIITFFLPSELKPQGESQHGKPADCN